MSTRSDEPSIRFSNILPISLSGAAALRTIPCDVAHDTQRYANNRAEASHQPTLEARLGKKGKREYVQTLRLLETFKLPEVSRAIDDALRLGAISFDAVKHLVLCRIEQRPARLDLENYPHLPTAQVATTAAADYLALLSQAAC